MTEVEAKKIVEWLCDRFKKKIVDFYERNDRANILMKFSERKWRVNYRDSTLSLDFEFAWDWPAAVNHDHFKWSSSTNKLCCITCEQQRGYDYILKVSSMPHTDAEFLDFLFGLNASVYVDGWFEDGVYFIYPGESIEEIKVKMDLEEIS